MSSEYLHKELFKGKGSPAMMTAIPLLISAVLANLGFMGIANMLMPILQILCPGLIILCILNIFNRLYELRTPKTPIYIAFGVSLAGYLIVPVL